MQTAEGSLGSRARLMESPVSYNSLLLEMPKGALEKLQRMQRGWPAGLSLGGRAVPSQPTEKCHEKEVAAAGARKEVCVQQPIAESEDMCCNKG